VQDYSPDFFSWSTIIPSVAQTDIPGTHLRELGQQDEECAAASQRTPNAPPVSANFLLPRYAPSKERHENNIASFLSKTKVRDPAGARSPEQLFSLRETRRPPVGARPEPVAGSEVSTVDTTCSPTLAEASGFLTKGYYDGERL
jgi:hypothetical protein